MGATLTDTLLAMTIFRGDFDAQFGKLLVCLIFLKFFHWTARLRVDYIAQTISFSRQCRYCFFLWCIFFFGIENSFFDCSRFIALLRLSALVAVLLWADLAFVWHSVQSVLESGVGVTVLFGFEVSSDSLFSVNHSGLCVLTWRISLYVYVCIGDVAGVCGDADGRAPRAQHCRSATRRRVARQGLVRALDRLYCRSVQHAAVRDVLWRGGGVHRPSAAPHSSDVLHVSSLCAACARGGQLAPRHQRHQCALSARHRCRAARAGQRRRVHHLSRGNARRAPSAVRPLHSHRVLAVVAPTQTRLSHVSLVGAARRHH